MSEPVVAFKVGDVVRLKSGGPPMTVYRLGEEGRGLLRACWFDTLMHLHRDAFAPAELEQLVMVARQ